MKVLVKSPYGMYSGYGNDGFGMVRALQKWGCDVYVQPTWVDVPLPLDLLPLFGKPLIPPFDLIINHWDPSNLKIDEHARRCARVVVAWTMWEFTSLTPHCAARSSLKDRLKWYDLVLGYDQVSVDAMAPWIPKGVALAKLQGGYEADNWKPVDRDWTSSRFQFGMHGALNGRKNPFMVLEAFRELKDEHPEEFAPASLVFHTTCPPLFPELNEIMAPHRIRVYYEVWDDPTLREFYRSCHCLVYPSKGEGKNLPGLEFTSTGGVMIGTDWGGHKEWLGPHIGWPLKYEMQPTFARHPKAAHHAETTLEAVKDAMWDVYTHREEARSRGALGAELLPKQCDWSVVVENLFRRIRDNVPGPGEVIWSMAQECHRRTRSS